MKATTTISIILSRGTPQTFTLILEPDWFMTGNATTTINYLRTELAKQTPGVNYTFIQFLIIPYHLVDIIQTHKLEMVQK